METYYKVTNTSDALITWPWVSGLLTAKEKADYEAWKQTPEFLGRDEEDIQKKKKQPEATRAKIYFQKRNIGLPFETNYTDKEGTKSVMELRWHLAPNYEKLKNPEKIYSLVDICQTYSIPFEPRDTIEKLLERIEARFGKNYTALTKSQLDESGLRSLVKTKIVQRNKRPGDPEFYYEGLLEIEEIHPQEAEIILGRPVHEDGNVGEDTLEKMPYDKLKAMAKEKGIENYQKKSKMELIQLLSFRPAPLTDEELNVSV